MAVELNHTIVPARDPQASAAFLADMLGLPAPTRFCPFHCVVLDNGVTLDFLHDAGDIAVQHYAFLVGEAEFDRVHARIRERGLPHWADPGHHQAGRINRRDGGRGVYWDDLDGHRLEILTRPYGSGAEGDVHAAGTAMPCDDSSATPDRTAEVARVLAKPST